jgi:acyl-CoA dehydrogenase
MAELLFDKELQVLKKSVQSFIREYVECAEDSPGRYELHKEVVNRLQEKAEEFGLKGLGAKKEWGGAGLSVYARAILFEEAAQHRFGLYQPAGDSFGGEVPSFLEACSQKQIEVYVKPAIQSGRGCFVALWEEHEDNHMEKLTTSAVRDKDEWVVNGKKTYIENLDKAAFGVVLVNCLLENGEQAPTLFLLDSIEQNEKKETTLIDVHFIHSISFNNFRIHDNQRIGAIGKGTDLLKLWLAESQVLLAAKCIGVSVKALEYGKQYAQMRITRGKPLAEYPTIRSMIGRAVINLQAARLMVQDAANKVDNQGHDSELAAQMAKHVATETAAKIIDDILQIHGGSGFAGDLPIERWYKEIRIARVNLLKSETIIENAAGSFL